MVSCKVLLLVFLIIGISSTWSKSTGQMTRQAEFKNGFVEDDKVEKIITKRQLKYGAVVPASMQNAPRFNCPRGTVRSGNICRRISNNFMYV